MFPFVFVKKYISGTKIRGGVNRGLPFARCICPPISNTVDGPLTVPNVVRNTVRTNAILRTLCCAILQEAVHPKQDYHADKQYFVNTNIAHEKRKKN